LAGRRNGTGPALSGVEKIILQRMKLFRHVGLLWFGRLVDNKTCVLLR
jgi:hypothetical protein